MTSLIIGIGLIIGVSLLGAARFFWRKGRMVVPEDHVAVTTNKDGFIKRIVPAGRHRLGFDSGGWFAGQGAKTFYPEVVIVFEVTDPDAHHHVPLLLSPFAYSTYRGS